MEIYILFCGILFIYQATIWMLKPTSDKKTDEYLDGPRSLGVFGNLFILRSLQIQPERELMSIARKWGATCLLWAGQFPILIVNQPKAVKEILVDVLCSSAYHLKQPSYSS